MMTNPAYLKDTVEPHSFVYGHTTVEPEGDQGLCNTHASKVRLMITQIS